MHARTALPFVEPWPAHLMRFAGDPVPGISPRLATAIRDVGHGLREPDPTLDEVRVALLGTGLTWTPERKLALSAERVALLKEFEAVIEAFGRNTKVAELFG